MVSQWQNQPSRLYGNSVAPLLISPQGYHKSTFCRRLLPDALKWGYTDSLTLSDRRQVMLAMSQQLLINLDEFNQISPRVQQGFLKNVIQLPSIKAKRPYGTHLEELPRKASFIATSNMTDILSDPSGNRRFIGIELTAPIDTSRVPDHRQLFAQALQLLRNGSRSWFDKAETEQIMLWNRRYEIQEPADQYFSLCFSVANDPLDPAAEWLSTAEIFDVIKQKVGSSLQVNTPHRLRSQARQHARHAPPQVRNLHALSCEEGGAVSWQIARSGWQIGWQISLSQPYLPAFTILIMSAVQQSWKIWQIFSRT